MRTVAFIDASNLFYGGEKSLGWRIDYKKLLEYLRRKYGVERTYYFGGVEIHHFPFDNLQNVSVPIGEVDAYLRTLIREKGDDMGDAELKLLGRHHKRVRFFQKLAEFGYILMLKPTKTYYDGDGNPIRKANCDVDMTLALVIERDSFDRVMVLSGDGDFLPVLKHLRAQGKEVVVMARAKRTAKDIKRFAGNRFLDFQYLQTHLEFKEGR